MLLCIVQLCGRLFCCVQLCGRLLFAVQLCGRLFCAVQLCGRLLFAVQLCGRGRLSCAVQLCGRLPCGLLFYVATAMNSVVVDAAVRSSLCSVSMWCPAVCRVLVYV
jgi:hypothetical protein